jgi:hypothetical protein
MIPMSNCIAHVLRHVVVTQLLGHGNLAATLTAAQVELLEFIRDDKRGLRSTIRAGGIARQLLAHLNEPAIRARICAADAPAASSAAIQECFLEFARAIGFRDEARGLFSAYKTSGLRPDYYLPLEGSGLLLEVERGKTTINNMDLLDFWKCHLCHEANYLFLMVPKSLRQNATMRPRNEFALVANRLCTFFEPRNYTNVFGLWLFGY